jgi:type 1 glutamine amidotransferase
MAKKPEPFNPFNYIMLTQFIIRQYKQIMQLFMQLSQHILDRTRPKTLSLLTLCLMLGTSSMAQSFDVLVFSKTEGFRHNSIEVGVSAIQTLGEQHDFGVDATEDASVFTAENLQGYDVVMFLNTTGNVLNGAQQDAFEGFIQQGGGFVGVHAASDTEYEWPWFGQLVGAYFDSHPRIQQATVLVEDTTHVSTKHLPVQWQRTDEWYNYSENPRGKVHVLASLDESSYRGGNMGEDHPIAWMHEFDGGRAWYTGGGHTKESYAEPAFLVHILGGIRYAAGVGGAP